MVACHAPGQASKNPVERRMASLSKALSRFILPYEMSEKTDDEEIKLRSAEHTGNALSDIWSKTVMYNLKVLLNKDLPI